MYNLYFTSASINISHPRIHSCTYAYVFVPVVSALYCKLHMPYVTTIQCICKSHMPACMCTHAYVYVYVHVHISGISFSCSFFPFAFYFVYAYDNYGVATIRRLLKMIGLFCRISSLL